MRWRIVRTADLDRDAHRLTTLLRDLGHVEVDRARVLSKYDDLQRSYTAVLAENTQLLALVHELYALLHDDFGATAPERPTIQ